MENKSFRLLILYATQTGNALDAAERAGREAGRLGCPAVVFSMSDFDANFLPHEDAVVFIVSTTGQGDVPESMKAFWRFLLRRNLSSRWLETVYYAVFGLGDSGYQKYNFVAKKLDKRLSDLGAQVIVEKGLGDDQHPSGYEGALDPWLLNLWTNLKEIMPSVFQHGMDVLNPYSRILDPPKYQVLYHSADTQSQASVTSDVTSLKLQTGRARAMHPAIHNGYTMAHCFLRMAKNERLTTMGCRKDVRHFDFEVLPAVFDYQVGDVLHILPGQSSKAVDAFLQRCNLNPDMYITVHSFDNEKCRDSLVDESHYPINLRSFVELTMDVASASPRRYFFEVMGFFATAEHEKEKLQYFASPEGRDDLYQYNQKERRTVLEVLMDFPSVHMPFDWLVQLVPQLKTRAFSISSAPLIHPNHVHLTVGVVSWMTAFRRQRLGLCSSWLASLHPLGGNLIPAWFSRGSLRMPPPSVPLILIGPGTGCAPFRAFVQERAMQRVLGPIAPILFFFGCWNENGDFLYRDFWLSHMEGSGVLTRSSGGGFFVAFSRDQPQKIYVQHKMKAESQRIWALLCQDAAVFVAGSATKMPSDVFSCMEEIVSRESDLPRDLATRWLTKLEKEGRYNVETWS